MNLISTKIIVPQHLDYFIVDRDLAIIEYSPNAARFFCSNHRLIKGQNIRFFLPELRQYQLIIKDILAGNIEYFSLPEINTNFHRSYSMHRQAEINQTAPCCLLPVFYTLGNNSPKITDAKHQFNNPALVSACSECCFLVHLTAYQSKDDNYLVIFLEEINHNKASKQPLLNRVNQYIYNQFKHQATEYNYFYEQVFASMAEALIITNDRGIIQLVNQSTVDLLGYSQAELVNQSINTIIADPNFLLSEIQQYLLTQGELIKNIEVVCQTKQKLTQIISFTCSRIKTDDRDDNRLIYLGRDITSFKHYQQRQNAQFHVSEILATSQDFTQAAPNILQVICESLDLMVGEIWLPPTKTSIKPKLKCEAIWAKIPSQVDKLIKMTQKSTYALERDIIGTIWQNNSFYEYDNYSLELNFPRQTIALEVGLQGGFGLTIQGERKILAVMNFLGRKKRVRRKHR